MKLSPTEIFKGKKIFFIGGTGFVGKVTLSMLLHNFPDIGKVYATVRARDANESKIRFWTSIVTSPTFVRHAHRLHGAGEHLIRRHAARQRGLGGFAFVWHGAGCLKASAPRWRAWKMWAGLPQSRRATAASIRPEGAAYFTASKSAPARPSSRSPKSGPACGSRCSYQCSARPSPAYPG